MNQVQIQPIEFNNLRTGITTYGFTVRDNYGCLYSDSFKTKPSANDLEFLKEALEFKSPALEEITSQIVEAKSGITIGHKFYEWGEIAPIVDVAKGQRPFTGGPLAIGVLGKHYLSVNDPNGWSVLLAKSNFAEQLRVVAGDPEDESELSKDPAYLVDIEDGDRELRLRLSAVEFRRLILRSLTPTEWKKLFKTYGRFFWICENLYSGAGEALTPGL